MHPKELKLTLPMEVGNHVISTTTNVWETLLASHNGESDKVKKLVEKYLELIYAQYNSALPIHFAVREGHIELVKYLLTKGAHDPEH